MMRKIKIKLNTIVLICLFAITYSLNAQNDISSKKANELFNDGNFSKALEQYLVLIKESSDDTKLNYRIGVCYLNTNIDKSNAIPYLEKVIKTEKPNPNAFYLLGRAYHYGYRFNEAIEMLEKFKILDKGNTFNLEDVEKQIEYCYNAIEIMKFPLDITFKNIGNHINSSFKDYYPFVPLDEGFLVFNSKRDDGSEKLPNGSYFSEIYISKVKNGVFQKARKLDQNVNTLNGSEEIIGLSADGKKMLFYFDNEEYYGDLFVADFKDDKVKNVVHLPKEINSKNHEIAASINNDGNELYFASDRDGGYGGVDLYISRILPNGKWGPAQNLGPTVNTKYDEDFPNISPDGKTLYFSSKGHTSMGGYDIFKASWNPVKRNFGDVKNLGYPINTPEDNMNYRVSESGRTGYMSMLRADSFGNLDIYSVTFNEVEPQYTLIKGHIKVADSTDQQITDVFISVLDLQTDELYGNYMTNPITGRYIMILPPGRYNVLVEVSGFENYTENIEIYGKSSFRSSIKKDFFVKSTQ